METKGREEERKRKKKKEKEGSELLNGGALPAYLIHWFLLNRRWKSALCLLLACQPMARRHPFPWLVPFISQWFPECNYTLDLRCIIHTITIPQPSLLFINRGDICSIVLEVWGFLLFLFLFLPSPLDCNTGSCKRPVLCGSAGAGWIARSLSPKSLGKRSYSVGLHLQELSINCSELT